MGRVSVDDNPSQAAVTAVGLLEALSDRLGAAGWELDLVAPPGSPPALKVRNPAVPLMSDRVMAALMADGSWWFWWGFGVRIADAADLDHVVDVIGRVLSLAGDLQAGDLSAAEMNRFGSPEPACRTGGGRMWTSSPRLVAA